MFSSGEIVFGKKSRFFQKSKIEKVAAFPKYVFIKFIKSETGFIAKGRIF